MNNPAELSIPEDLRAIGRSVLELATSYRQQDFSARQVEILKVYFDLGQGHQSLEEYYRLTVAAPLVLDQVSSALYLQQNNGELALVCSSEQGLLAPPEPVHQRLRLQDAPYADRDGYVLPILNGRFFYEQSRGREECCTNQRVMGLFVVRREGGLSQDDLFFFLKYTEQIATGLYNRILYHQYAEKWDFITSLVADIEHNVIVPNMYFKHLVNHLQKKISLLEGLRCEICEEFGAIGLEEQEVVPALSRRVMDRLQIMHQELQRCHGQIVKHYGHMSLFIESLFRKEHFERGHLVLRPKRCFLEKEVIIPQLEYCADRLRVAQITVDRPQNMYEEEFPILVDIGLLAQVYANLFSNAAKYTAEIIGHDGRPRKAMAYGRELVDDFLRIGQKGIKFNVFTTGPSMSVRQGTRLFLDGVRGEGSGNTPGSGHGLSFIRHVIEMHGGSVGYEPTPEGNNFYFILPLPPLEYPLIPAGT